MAIEDTQTNPKQCNCCNCCSGHRSFWSRHKGKIIFSLILLIFVILPIFSIFSFFASIGDEVKKQEDEKSVISGSGEDKIALVNISGIIMEQAEPIGFGLSDITTTTRRMKKIFQDISKDEKVKGVILYVNSPGGSAAASEEIYREILRFKTNSRKPVYAYFSDIAASGGLYVSMASDKIIANPATITGSIGVIIEYLNFGDLAAKYGVKQVVYKSGDHKDIISEFRDPTDTEKQIMQSLITDTYQSFVAVVKDGRKMPENKVREIADGRVLSAKSAKENGLVDEVGTFEDSVQYLKSELKIKDASVVEFGRPDFFESLLGSMSHKFNLNLLPGANSYFNGAPGTKLLYLYNP